MIAEIWPKFGLCPFTIWVPHSKAIIQLPPLLRSPFEPSEDIMRGVLFCIYWNNGNTAWFSLKCLVSAWIHSGCCWWYSFHVFGIGFVNFCTLWLILIVKLRFKLFSSIGKQSSGISEHIDWEYGIVVIVWEVIGDENHCVMILFCRWYISLKNREYKNGWNWECWKCVAIQCPSFFSCLKTSDLLFIQ